MSEPFIGEIRIFAFTFAPRNWADCDGQLMAINQNEALFSLLGTMYGGDGRTTFGLPDLRGRVALHEGSGPGLSSRRIGERGGAAQVTLTVQSMPNHTHNMNASSADGDQHAPANHYFSSEDLGGEPTNAYATTADVTMHPQMITNAGGGQGHSNLMPYLTVRYCIALIGIFPSRS